MNLNIRIAVVEDSAEYRRPLVAAIESRPGWQVVAQCSDAPSAAKEVPSSHPNLVLLDLLLPGGSAVDLLPQLCAKLPRIPIIMLTVVDAPDEIVRALKAGASGYIIKGGTSDELIAHIEDAVTGGATMSPAVARRIVEWFQHPPSSPMSNEHGLTSREWEALRLAARGKQHGEIALALGIAVNTVKNHFRNIYEKLGVNSLTEAFVKLNDGRGLLDGK